jgi:hypothetical protein
VNTVEVNTLDLVHRCASDGEERTMATTNLDRERALAWIAAQLRWERTLAHLRGERASEFAGERQAA